MAERIYIDGAVLSQEIACLQGVRSRSVVDRCFPLVSKGHTARSAGQLAALFLDLDEALNTLIDQTSEFLVNVQDTFVDVDEKAAAAAARLQDEVSG